MEIVIFLDVNMINLFLSCKENFISKEKIKYVLEIKNYDFIFLVFRIDYGNRKYVVKVGCLGEGKFYFCEC